MVNGLALVDGLAEGDVDNLIVGVANHEDGLTLEQGIDGGFSHARSKDAVECLWR